MKNEYKVDYDGKDVLVLNYEDQYGTSTVEVLLSGGGMSGVQFFEDHCLSPAYINISFEDWGEVKAFVDKKIYENRQGFSNES